MLKSDFLLNSEAHDGRPVAIVAGGLGDRRDVGNSSEIWDFTKGDTTDWEWRKFVKSCTYW